MSRKFIVATGLVVLIFVFIAGRSILDQDKTSQLLEEANQKIALLEQEKDETLGYMAKALTIIDGLSTDFTEIRTENAKLEKKNERLEFEAEVDADATSLYKDRMEALRNQLNAEYAPVTGDGSSPWEKDQAFREAINTQDYPTAYSMLVSTFRDYCTLEVFSELMSENDVTLGEVSFLDQAVGENNMFATLYLTTGFEGSNKISAYMLNEGGQWMIPLDPAICIPPPPGS